MLRSHERPKAEPPDPEVSPRRPPAVPSTHPQAGLGEYPPPRGTEPRHRPLPGSASRGQVPAAAPSLPVLVPLMAAPEAQLSQGAGTFRQKRPLLFPLQPVGTELAWLLWALRQNRPSMRPEGA